LRGEADGGDVAGHEVGWHEVPLEAAFADYLDGDAWTLLGHAGRFEAVGVYLDENLQERDFLLHRGSFTTFDTPFPATTDTIGWGSTRPGRSSANTWTATPGPTASWR